ncbi:rod-binding protein [uncultured Sphingomonas sp.]|uniref:rod-binding protein n=1 Tax=uncultured Sphingomonas sp. TaxID=158754 RepID=UPI0025DA705D|nr:rod-binding protein [uncultured Sphingomonas sp.]
MKQLKETAKQFEAVFLRQLIGTMRSASLGDGVFDSSSTEQFRDMADARTAEAMAGKGALGVADLLVKQFGARLATTTPKDAAPTPAAPKDEGPAK